MNISTTHPRTINIGGLSNNDKLNKKNSTNSLTGNNNLIKALEKQKESIQDEIEGIKNSNMDQKSKQSTINDLNKQISQIDSKISEIKSEKLTHTKEKEKSEKKKKGSVEKETDDENSENPKQINKLGKVFSDISQLSKMNDIKSNMKQQIKVILSDPNPVTGAYSKFQINTMDELSSNIGKLDEKITSKMKEINNASKNNVKNKISKASKENQTDNTTTSNNKDDKNVDSTQKTHKKAKINIEA